MATDDGTPAASGDSSRRAASATPRDPDDAFAAWGEEPLATAAGTRGKAGELDLVFAESGGETRLVRDYASVPFHLPGGLTHDEQLPEAATAYVQSPTGAIAQGDRHEWSVTVEEGASAHVSTGSAEKVHEMERNYGRVDVELTVEEGGYLEFLPEPTILHADARYRQETTLSVAEDAAAVVGEILVPGRLARGEAFDFERAYSTVTARGPEGLLFADANDLHPAVRDPQRPGVMGEHRVLGTLFVVGAPALADELHETVTQRDGTRAGATALPNDAGVMVRVLGEGTAGVKSAMTAAWATAREALAGADVPRRRKD